uniref:Uncharacterized protein n=1 Tax=Vitis vinifera TaxID=29760 RepID=F6GTN5_VITVI
MAINICSETSPRISFSNDFCQADVASIDHCKSRNSELSSLDSSPDFDFCVSTSFEHESSSADELFSNGIILPIKIQERTVAPRSVASLPPLPSPSTNESLKKESSKGIAVSSCESQEKLQSSKSFWPFKRSSSLNCDNVHRRSLMCSLPLLSRSNSTGSVQNSKRTSKQNSQKQPSMAKSSSSSSSASSTNFYTYPVPQKPPLKKNYGGSYGNDKKRLHQGVDMKKQSNKSIMKCLYLLDFFMFVSALSAQLMRYFLLNVLLG